MIPIMHKVNTVEAMKTVDKRFGMEVDVRERNGKIIMEHDAFKDGQLFEDLLVEYKHRFIAVDIKCEGIETAVAELLKKYGIKDYFLLGMTLPWSIKLINSGMRNISFHFSEIEPLGTAKNMVGKADWVWVDCFTKLPFDMESYSFLKRHFKICLGSPDMLGRKQDIKTYKEQLKEMPVDAVCTDYPELWE